MMTSVIVFTANDAVAVLIAPGLVAALRLLYVAIHSRVLHPAGIGLFRGLGRGVITIGLSLGFQVFHGIPRLLAVPAI